MLSRNETRLPRRLDITNQTHIYTIKFLNYHTS